MNAIGQVVTEIANREFNGECYNGPNFLTTLHSLSLEQVISTETLEGYSVYGIALHVLLCKHMMCRHLEGQIEEYPYDKADFPKVPGRVEEADWQQILDKLVEYHDALNRTILEIDDAGLEKPIPEWRIPRRNAVIWYPTHDTYHTAQIRNMGVPGLEIKPPAQVE
jgi:hypothetical protein